MAEDAPTVPPGGDDTDAPGRVVFKVDGAIVNATAPPEGYIITGNDLLIRLSQQEECIDHTKSILARSNEYVKAFVKNAQEER